MHNSYSHVPSLCAGLDVSADWIDVARRLDDRAPEHRRFDNDADGHAALCRWLAGDGRRARVVMEARGIYGVDLALALHEAPGVEVMVMNTRAAKDYRRAQMHRSKTDEVDAAVLCDYAQRQPFVAWEPPEGAAAELRQLARRIADLTA